MCLTICKYGDPVLRKKAVPVQEVTDEIRKLADEMLETMYKERGVGLAAEQVGHWEAICVIDIPPESDCNEQGERHNPDVKMPLVLINPKIISRSETTVEADEGCLSFPGIFAKIERAYEVNAEFLDRSGQEQTIHAKGLLARAVQHEIDHLDGILFIDRMSPVKRVTLSGKLKRLARETKRSLNKRN